MGHTNSTVNYNLPQFVGTDKPSWLGDINNAFSAIDTAIASAASTATTADGKADALGTVVSGHTTQIGTLSNTVTSQGNTLNTVTALIGNGTPTTTDQTIIGAINEINAEVTKTFTEVASSVETGSGSMAYTGVSFSVAKPSIAIVNIAYQQSYSSEISVSSSNANQQYAFKATGNTMSVALEPGTWYVWGNFTGDNTVSVKTIPA